MELAQTYAVFWFKSSGNWCHCSKSMCSPEHCCKPWFSILWDCQVTWSIDRLTDQLHSYENHWLMTLFDITLLCWLKHASCKGFSRCELLHCEFTCGALLAHQPTWFVALCQMRITMLTKTSRSISQLKQLSMTCLSSDHKHETCLSLWIFSCQGMML